jgi:hypothetical protein
MNINYQLKAIWQKRQPAVIIVFLLGLSYGINAQTIPATVDIKSPEVAAFNKNIETPVSLYTGVPNISIPLYNIHIRDVDVPITLDYHAGGIRADEEATWVGLGWSLNYGGQITRTIKGSADEKSYFGATGEYSVAGFNSLPTNITTDVINGTTQIILSTSDEEREEDIEDAKMGESHDYMPDDFHYSVLGYSGEFMFSQPLNKFVLFPREDISVQQFSNPPGSFGLNAAFYYWNLQLPNGISVDFGKDAVTSQSNLSASTPATKSSWLVKCIRNNTNDSISYSYNPYSYSAYKLTGESYLHTQEIQSESMNVSQFGYSDVQVNSISFPNGTINFITAPRSDMPTNYLSEIDVVANSGVVLRKVVFYYSYFYGNNYDILPTINPIINNYVPTAYKFQRLRLDSLKILGGVEKPLTYKFDYYSNSQAPSKFTFSQDHWGFYNGIANTGIYTFMPSLYPFSNENISGFAGGDRRVNPSVSNMFSLHDITYPEGGKTEMVYENNAVNLSGIPVQLLNTYQDNNLRDTSAVINFSGWARSNFEPTPPTEIGGAGYFYKYFTISSDGYQAIGLNWSITTNYGISASENNTPYNDDYVYFSLQKLNYDGNGNTQLVKDFSTTPASASSGPPYTRVGNDNAIIQLGPGNYVMTAKIVYLNPPGSVADNQPHSSQFKVTWRELDPTTRMVYAGGLRVKDLNYYGNDGQLLRRKEYHYVNPGNIYNMPNFSSGRVVSFPQYLQLATDFNTGMGYKIASNSVLPLESTAGSYCGYEYVDEYDVDVTNASNNLRTNYFFSFSAPLFSQYYNYENLGAYEPQEWTRGKLLTKKIYKGNNVIQQEDYSYYAWSPHLQNQTNEDYVTEISTDLISYQSMNTFSPEHSGTTITPSVVPPDFYDFQPAELGNQSLYGPPEFYYYCYSTPSLNVAPPGVVPNFTIYTGFDKMQFKKTTTIDDFGNTLVTVDSFMYQETPALYQVTQTKTYNSKGEVLLSQMKYPNDFAATSPYASMLQRHILSPVILKSDYNNGVFLKTGVANYNDWGNNILAPISTQEQMLNYPVDTRQQFYSYDNHGNPASYSKANDAIQTYLWDYNFTYPTAKALNASLSDIAFTSFEADGSGNWTTGGKAPLSGGITGGQYYSLNSDISRSGLNTSTNYIVSYWSLNGAYSIPGTANGYPIKGKTVTMGGVLWTYYEHSVTGQSTVQIHGSGGIDELRLYPASAQMTTYTYAPLIGMTSQCDVANRITYYFYDGLGRLSYLKDQDGNIVKTYQYHYWNQ